MSAYARLTLVTPGVLLFRSSYSPQLNAALKQHLPPPARGWDGAARGWRIDAQYAKAVADLCTAYLKVTPAIPATTIPTSPAPRETKVFEVRYLGRAKARTGGDWFASAWVRTPQPGQPATERGQGGWGLIITLQALRRHLEPYYQLRDPGDGEDQGDAAPAPAAGVVTTYYDTLGVLPDADADALRAAYRVLVLQTHPDHNHELDANEKFIALQEAFDTLRDPATRQRYDRGLQLEAQAQAALHDPGASPFAGAPPLAAIGVDAFGWAPPLRAGFFLVLGRPAVRGFRATHIIDSQPIADSAGHVLVSSWPKDGEDFHERWVLP